MAISDGLFFKDFTKWKMVHRTQVFKKYCIRTQESDMDNQKFGESFERNLTS